ncbi:hypothetical protein TSAR_002669 [Trichomalopsis sarcophagae]|uniref:Endonuclease/exonuclease/phosphatase domain-containing protein n=1 Tax=Trichomalopsis sarcophagae TaxID=543379 RepID=A0A232EH16_9HYME|nr:hypothetical protein TSAR_002669 [Trichomalopsis sarcophagae]
MASTNIKKRKSLKCLFWNAKSLNKRIQELPALLLNLDVFVCVETAHENVKSPDTSVQMCGIRITNTNPSLDLIVCYRTPGSTLSQAQ